MKQEIGKLIADYEWAGHNSITFGDGSMVLLDVEFYSKGNYYISPIADTTIESYLKYNSDELSAFDVFDTAEYSDYIVHVGDGSSEENGVIFVTKAEDKSLVWFCFFECSEPFKKVTVDDEGVICAISAVNITWKLSIDNPVEIELVYP